MKAFATSMQNAEDSLTDQLHVTACLVGLVMERHVTKVTTIHFQAEIMRFKKR